MATTRRSCVPRGYRHVHDQVQLLFYHYTLLQFCNLRETSDIAVAMLTESWTTLLSIFALAPSILAATVTLTDLPAYQSQRGCAIPCFHIGYGGAGGPDQLADQLDCSVSPIENDCFCRADLQDDADALIQSCVYEACSGNTIDVSSAVSIYDSYCTAAGFTRAVETTAVQGISGM